MSDLKKMYKTVSRDPFPAEMSIQLGGETLVFAKKTWSVGGETLGLRYGENPDQPAALYTPVSGGLSVEGAPFRGPGKALLSGMTEAAMLQAGKHPGKINLTDVDNAINILQYLTKTPAAVILKHNNPCGAAKSGSGVADALVKAFNADRIAAFGGAVVVNRPIDLATAEFIDASYFEVVAAPGFETGALDVLKRRKNLRILELPALADLSFLVDEPFFELKSLVDGGLIAQFSFRNRIHGPEDFLPAEATDKEGRTLLARRPTEKEFDDLVFAWAVEAGVTSNSILFAKDGVAVAVGTGEQDRVGCVDLTIHKAHTKFADGLSFAEHKLSIYELRAKARKDPKYAEILADVENRAKAAKGGLPGSVAVSDGFFPFRDGVDCLIDAGVTAVAQPGGSIRDVEVIEAVNEASPEVAMVFTGQRSFKH